MLPATIELHTADIIVMDELQSCVAHAAGLAWSVALDAPLASWVA